MPSGAGVVDTQVSSQTPVAAHGLCGSRPSMVCWIQPTVVASVRAAARKVGVRLTERGIGRGVARWLPVIGAMGVGAYAWYDTRHVARTAINLFAMEAAISSSWDGDESALYD